MQAIIETMNEYKQASEIIRHHNKGSAPILKSEALFRGGTEIIIRHHGADYRMKITRQGKLILNK